MKFEVNLTKEANDFVSSLPKKMKAKTRRTISLLNEYGYALTEPHSKKLKSVNNLYELRVKLGSDICRLFYFHWKDKIYIITSGYVKKTDKADIKEINRAIGIMKEIKEG